MMESVITKVWEPVEHGVMGLATEFNLFCVKTITKLS